MSHHHHAPHLPHPHLHHARTGEGDEAQQNRDIVTPAVRPSQSVSVPSPSASASADLVLTDAERRWLCTVLVCALPASLPADVGDDFSGVEKSGDADTLWSLQFIDNCLKQLNFDNDTKLREQMRQYLLRSARGERDALLAECRAQLFAGRSDANEREGIRWLLMQQVLALCVGDGHYDARARVAARFVTANVLSFDWLTVQHYEDALAGEIRAAAGQETEEQRAAREKRDHNRKLRRWGLIGAAGVLGGLAVGLTAGLATPFVAAAAAGIVGTSAVAVLGGTTGAIMVGTLFGAGGAGLTGLKMNKRVGELQEFAFDAIWGSDQSGLHLVIGIPGYLSSDRHEPDSAALQWRKAELDEVNAIYALRWESEVLSKLSDALFNLVKSRAWGFAVGEVIKQTLFGALLSAIALPMNITAALDIIIANPWSVGQNRADEAGQALADVLESRVCLVHGNRPVTLVGYSLGARVILVALDELAKRNVPVKGVVMDAFLLGTPHSADPEMWLRARSVVAGRLVNVYSHKDSVLAYIYRATSFHARIAGLRAIGCDGVEDIDVSHLVSSHLDYRKKLPHLMSLLGLRHAQHEPDALGAEPSAAAAADVEDAARHEHTQASQQQSSSSSPAFSPATAAAAAAADSSVSSAAPPPSLSSATSAAAAKTTRAPSVSFDESTLTSERSDPPKIHRQPTPFPDLLNDTDKQPVA